MGWHVPCGEPPGVDQPSLTLDELATSRFPLLEYAPDAIVLVDDRGVIRLVNAQTERLFGYYREELVGQPVEILVPHDTRASHVADRADYASDPRVRPMGVGLDLHGLRKDGTSFPVEISLSPVETRDGTYVAAAIRDVTERKAFEVRLRELNAELERASRAKDQFLASMSHELRTPLNAIIGFTGTLLMELPGPLAPEQRRQLEIVQSSAQHLLALITDILDLAKIESGKRELTFEPVRIGEVVAAVAGALGTMAAAKRLTLRTVGVDSETVAITDRRALHQIVLNLVNNAIKYTDAGSVSIAVERVATGDRAGVRIGVADTGIGIKAEDLSRLFRAFEQLDPSSTRRHEGTGLGLYLCRNLATLIGATIEASSTLGSGSRFTLTLPLER